jgi:hypothetical protein
MALPFGFAKALTLRGFFQRGGIIPSKRADG